MTNIKRTYSGYFARFISRDLLIESQVEKLYLNHGVNRQNRGFCSFARDARNFGTDLKLL